MLAAGLLLAVAPAVADDVPSPQPYGAADPVCAPMSKKPFIAAPTPDKVSLGEGSDIEGPLAGP